jgi:TPR repeat protein
VKLAASQGVVLAQDGLAVLYAQGLGVPEDIKEAIRLWTVAANQGDADAQSNLGYLYESGNGVTKDLVQAYVWYSLVIASNPGNAYALVGRQSITKKMTPAQLAEAQGLVRNWKPK